MAQKLNEVAEQIRDEDLTTAKGTLRRYRHAIQDTVNHRVLAPGSPQAQVKRLLKGRVGLSFDEQAENFLQVIKLTAEAREGNRKAQSCNVIASKALAVVDARRAEQRRAAVAVKPSVVESWEDDDEEAEDEEFSSDW